MSCCPSVSAISSPPPPAGISTVVPRISQLSFLAVSPSASSPVHLPPHPQALTSAPAIPTADPIPKLPRTQAPLLSPASLGSQPLPLLSPCLTQAQAYSHLHTLQCPPLYPPAVTPTLPGSPPPLLSQPPSPCPNHNPPPRPPGHRHRPSPPPTPPPPPTHTPIPPRLQTHAITRIKGLNVLATLRISCLSKPTTKKNVCNIIPCSHPAHLQLLPLDSRLNQLHCPCQATIVHPTASHTLPTCTQSHLQFPDATTVRPLVSPPLPPNPSPGLIMTPPFSLPSLLPLTSSPLHATPPFPSLPFSSAFSLCSPAFIPCFSPWPVLLRFAPASCLLLPSPRLTCVHW